MSRTPAYAVVSTRTAGHATISPVWAETILHSFTGQAGDGAIAW
jgi:transcriptional regulator of met regulon